MALERTIVAQIRKALDREAGRRGQRIKHEKRHGSEFAVAGEPDLFGSIDGRHFEIEVKQPGRKPEPIQHRRLEEWKETGAITGWATTAEEACRLLWPDYAPAKRSPAKSKPATRT